MGKSIYLKRNSNQLKSLLKGQEIEAHSRHILMTNTICWVLGYKTPYNDHISWSFGSMLIDNHYMHFSSSDFFFFQK